MDDGSGLSFYRIRGKRYFLKGRCACSAEFTVVIHYCVKTRNSRKCQPHSFAILVKGRQAVSLSSFHRLFSGSSRKREPEEATSRSGHCRIVFRRRHLFGTRTTRSKPRAERKIEGDPVDCIICAVVTIDFGLIPISHASVAGEPDANNTGILRPYLFGLTFFIF